MTCGKDTVLPARPGALRFALLACIWAVPTFGQALWLQPERFAVTPGALLAFEVLEGEQFGDSTPAVSLKGLQAQTGHLGDATLVVSAAADPGGRARATATLPTPGVAVVAVDLVPAVRTLPRAEADAYLLAIHAPEPVLEAWRALPPDARWREMRFLRAKTFVRVGEPLSGEAPWRQRAASGLDVIAEQDPTAQRAGAALPVRVFRDGRPLPGVLVTYLSSGETREHVVVTDGEGRASALLDASGPWLIRTSLVDGERAADHEWRSETVTLTLDVR